MADTVGMVSVGSITCEIDVLRSIACEIDVLRLKSTDVSSSSLAKSGNALDITAFVVSGRTRDGM